MPPVHGVSCFFSAVSWGRTTVAGMPKSLAANANANARPWLPVEKQTAPLARAVAGRAARALYAPRNLNEPLRWKHSALR